MTGHEHYAEAERLLAEAAVPARERAKPNWRTADELIATAQVHATLAAAAAASALPHAAKNVAGVGYAESDRANGYVPYGVGGNR